MILQGRSIGHKFGMSIKYLYVACPPSLHHFCFNVVLSFNQLWYPSDFNLLHKLFFSKFATTMSHPFFNKDVPDLLPLTTHRNISQIFCETLHSKLLQSTLVFADASIAHFPSNNIKHMH